MEDQDRRLFWDWIGHPTTHGQLLIPNVAALNEKFMRLSYEEKRLVSREFYRHLEATNRLELWELCSLLAGQPCGDDSFAYFRRWLILQGADIFNMIFATPDSMAILRDQKETLPNEPFTESAGLVEDTAALPSIASTGPFQAPKWSWGESSLEHIRATLPNTYRLVGKRFQWSLPAATQDSDSCEAHGLGVIRVGDCLRHKKEYGDGVVTAVLVAETSVVEIEFSCGKKTMRVSSDFFERCDGH